ncbi:Anti-sigma F factor antagonist (spoIIAA-2) [Actinokineospora spheciospongiae]|uniref:Anti-sigma F factor antagonist (SpoIIAA-2) n=1 Tax=Actinokineospora spheciospongiae TaxID=909613 RepID=W7J4F5_9PSEU|nr:STAS domain-containing protein [Actinokineospora spheciospongiae]EWC63897.1 Anti-sigma F factor antagonist (spoIIAA-2) [Actinokineospora spheciospongiae]PWW51926.1 anti-anti-sigma factor [Actinokineospora spheciospongiae]
MTSPLLTVHREQIGPTVVVHAVGDVDLATVAQLSEALTEATKAPAAEGVVANLSGVGFLGSAGLSALVVARNEAEEAALPFTVVATGPARRALALTMLDSTLTVADALEDVLGTTA